jgi:hypothetical protein
MNRSVDHMEPVPSATESIEDFFARYTGHLTAGDIEASPPSITTHHLP